MRLGRFGAGLVGWRHDRVVEVAVVVITPDGTVHREYETLVNPQRDMGPSSIHQISAGDVSEAPTFADVAGDLLAILAEAGAVAGHNIRFDKNFLDKEYERVGVAFPEIPLLCTCNLFGRNNLRASCHELGIPFDGMPHRALSDARVTARLVSFLCSDDPALLEKHRLKRVQWPSVEPLNATCICREHARRAQEGPPRFLQRIASKIHHDVEAEMPDVLAYMALIDRVLEDRRIDQDEEDALVDAASSWRLSSESSGLRGPCSVRCGLLENGWHCRRLTVTP